MTEQWIKEKEQELGMEFNETEWEFLLSSNERWVCEAGEYNKKTIRDIVRQIKFTELKDGYWIYLSNKHWDGITDEIRREKWNELKDEECICFAGVEWSGITDEMRVKKWYELKDEQYIVNAGSHWSGITDEMRKKRWHELKDEKWIYWAGRDWDGITDEMRIKKFQELKDLRYTLEASIRWKRIDTENIFKKILVAEVNQDNLRDFNINKNNIAIIVNSFSKTKDQVLERLLNGEISHELFIKNYPVIREKVLSKSGLTDKDLSEFDYFYQNLSLSYGLLK